MHNRAKNLNKTALLDKSVIPTKRQRFVVQRKSGKWDLSSKKKIITAEIS